MADSRVQFQQPSNLYPIRVAPAKELPPTPEKYPKRRTPTTNSSHTKHSPTRQTPTQGTPTTARVRAQSKHKPEPKHRPLPQLPANKVDSPVKPQSKVNNGFPDTQHVKVEKPNPASDNINENIFPDATELGSQQSHNSDKKDFFLDITLAEDDNRTVSSGNYTPVTDTGTVLIRKGLIESPPPDRSLPASPVVSPKTRQNYSKSQYSRESPPQQATQDPQAHGSPEIEIKPMTMNIEQVIPSEENALNDEHKSSKSSENEEETPTLKEKKKPESDAYRFNTIEISDTRNIYGKKTDGPIDRDKALRAVQSQRSLTALEPLPRPLRPHRKVKSAAPAHSPQKPLPGYAFEGNSGMTKKRHVILWTSQEISQWVQSLKPTPEYKDYGQCFIDNHVSGNHLPELEREDLELFGVNNIDDCNYILKMIHQLIGYQNAKKAMTLKKRQSGRRGKSAQLDICAKCKKPIGRNSRKITHSDGKFHHDCYVCDKCGSHLQGNVYGEFQDPEKGLRRICRNCINEEMDGHHAVTDSSTFPSG